MNNHQPLLVLFKRHRCDCWVCKIISYILFAVVFVAFFCACGVFLDEQYLLILCRQFKMKIYILSQNLFEVYASCVKLRDTVIHLFVFAFCSVNFNANISFYVKRQIQDNQFSKYDKLIIPNHCCQTRCGAYPQGHNRRYIYLG